MKSMTDKKMDMKRGEPDSEAFFPESPMHKKMPRAGEMMMRKYPDTEEAIHSDQEEMVGKINRNQPKDCFRH